MKFIILSENIPVNHLFPRLAPSPELTEHQNTNEGEKNESNKKSANVFTCVALK